MISFLKIKALKEDEVAGIRISNTEFRVFEIPIDEIFEYSNNEITFFMFIFKERLDWLKSILRFKSGNSGRKEPVCAFPDFSRNLQFLLIAFIFGWWRFSDSPKSFPSMGSRYGIEPFVRLDFGHFGELFGEFWWIYLQMCQENIEVQPNTV